MPALTNEWIDSKKAIRELCRNERRTICPGERAYAERLIIEHISALPAFFNARHLLLFSPVKGEPDITPIAARALEGGKNVYFPVSDTETCHLTFRRITSLSELIPGSYHIPEPQNSAPAFHARDTVDALCLVPGLSFDRLGYRIGYGKGYYDRFLADFHGIAAGIVYSRFLFDTLPVSRFDRKVHLIITEKGVTVP